MLSEVDSHFSRVSSLDAAMKAKVAPLPQHQSRLHQTHVGAPAGPRRMSRIRSCGFSVHQLVAGVLPDSLADGRSRHSLERANVLSCRETLLRRQFVRTTLTNISRR